MQTDYRDYMDMYPLLDEKSEQELATKSMNGDKEARDKLIMSNLRLVPFIAKKVQGDLSMDDKIQEGMLALVNAANSFDPSKDSRFVSYAYKSIFNAMLRESWKNSGTVKLPERMRPKVAAVRKAKERLLLETGSKSGIQVLAEETGLTEREVSNILVLKAKPVYLDETIDEEGETTREARLILPAEEVGSALFAQEEKSELRHLVSQLSPRKQDILIRRLGLKGCSEMTLQEISELYHISRERVRQIEASAIRDLKNYLRDNPEVAETFMDRASA